MNLKKLMKLYASTKAIDDSFNGLAGSFWEQLDDFSMWTDLQKSVTAQTKQQREILGGAIFTLFPATVCTAKKAGLDNAKEFFDFVFMFPEVARQNRRQLCGLLRDLESRLKRNLSDDVFTVSEDDLHKLFEKAKAYDI